MENTIDSEQMSTMDSKSKTFTEMEKSKTMKSKKESQKPDLRKARSAQNVEEDANMKKVSYKADDFKIVKEVGEGSYGRVYLATRKADDK